LPGRSPHRPELNTLRIAGRWIELAGNRCHAGAGGVSIRKLAARWLSGQTGQVPGLGWSILDAPPTGTPGNVTKMM